jgi:inner membrane protein
MDSLTQVVLGASIAGACAPRGQRRKALLAGAALGTLPDLDVFIDFGGAVENFTYHRGFSHSLFVLAPFSVLLWLALKRWWAPVRAAPLPWLAAISLTLLTHPLLDAHTAYGTQLFWPLTVPPTS